MFHTPKPGSSSEPQKSINPSATVIARGVKVEGEFTSQGDVVIEGEVHGMLGTTGMLTVGSEAKIKADVKAGSAFISGTVEGNVTVGQQLEIKATAKVVGDITAETVMVEAGAVLMGKIEVGVKAAVAPVATNSSRRERSTVVSSPATPSEA